MAKSRSYLLFTRSQRGFALVLVLWVISLLTIMAGSFALTMRRESTITAGIKETAGAAAAAEAGIAFAEMMLLLPDQNKRWRPDGNIYQVLFGETEVRLRLISESGKININKVDVAFLQKLFEQSPLDEERQAKLIGAIMDWRDQDDLINIEGAEKGEYKKAGLKYQPRNKPFQAVEELQMVLGMDEQVYNWLEPMITVSSGQNNIDPKYATRQVLSMIPGLDATLIDSYLATRLENAKNDLPPPEFPAVSLKAGGAKTSETVTVISEALMPDESSAVINATLTKGGGQNAGLSLGGVGGQSEVFKVLKWQRNPTNQEPLFSEQMSQLLVKKYVEPELSD